MAEIIPNCPTGAVSFCQRVARGPVYFPSLRKHLRTKEALDDYTKFRRSLMDLYSSLVLLASTENEVPFDSESFQELSNLGALSFFAYVRSSGLIQHDSTIGDIYEIGWQGSRPDPSIVRKYYDELTSELYDLHKVHGNYAYRKSLANCDFIKWDSDLDETFERLVSEKKFPELSEDFLKGLLRQHLFILRELNDNLSGGNMLEEKNNTKLDAINKIYSKVLGDTTKKYEEMRTRNYFNQMEYKNLVHNRLDEAQYLRTEYVPQVSHLTTRMLFQLNDTALVAKSRMLEMFIRVGQRGQKYRARVTGPLLLIGLGLNVLGIRREMLHTKKPDKEMAKKEK